MEYNKSVEFTIKRHKMFSVTAKGWQQCDKWNWNVYAHVFDNNELINDPERVMSMTFNGGATFDQMITTIPAQGIKYDFQRESKKLTVGSDYAHIHDDYDNHPSPDDGVPGYVLRDALDLAEQLEAQSVLIEAPTTP